MFRRIRFGSPTSRAAFEEMAVMEQAVEHSSNRGAVAEQFSPVSLCGSLEEQKDKEKRQIAR
jgi:hypothetical protein